MKYTAKFISILCCLGLLLLVPSTGMTQTQDEAPLPKSKVGLPSLGLAGESHLSQHDERTLGSILWAQMRSDTAFIDDSLINAYLNRLILRLEQGLDSNERGGFKVFAVNDKQLNAFAMPGKLLGIHSGLILSIKREGELAAVLAHEIGHITQRHFARRVADQSNNQWIQWLGIATAIVAARSNAASKGNVFEGAILGSQAASVNQMLAFSRDMEREADTVGLQIMQSSKYDGSDMVRMLKRLSASGTLNDTGNSYARTHPGTLERMSQIEARLKQAYTPAGSVDTSLDFLLAQARLRAITATTGDSKSQAYFDFNEQLKSTFPAYVNAAHYGLALLAQIQNLPLNQSHNQSAVLAQHINAFTLSHPWLDALKVQVSVTPIELVNTRFKDPSVLTQYPELGFIAAQTLLKAPNTAQAALATRYLVAYLNSFPNDSVAWLLLAQAYQAQQLDYQAKYAQAEAFAKQHAWRSSLPLLNEAIKGAEKNQDLASLSKSLLKEQEIKAFLKEEQEFEQKLK